MAFSDMNTGLRVGLGFATGGASEVTGRAMDFLGGSGKKPWYDPAVFAARRAEIGRFGESLASARAKYVGSLKTMYDHAYSRFTNNAEAGFAARGLQVGGGAFASALAKQTADYQAQLEPQVYQAERQDLGTLDNAYGNLFNADVAARSGSGNAEYTADRSDRQALGNFAGQLAMRGFGPQNGRSLGSVERTGTSRNGKIYWDRE